MRLSSMILPALAALCLSVASAPAAKATVLGAAVASIDGKSSAEPVYYYKRRYNDNCYRPSYRRYSRYHHDGYHRRSYRRNDYHDHHYSYRKQYRRNYHYNHYYDD